MVANGKLYTQVMEKLKFNPRLDISNLAIAIQGDHDTVLLEGKVGSFLEKIIAVNTVKETQGVKVVIDEIKVEPDLKYKRSDTEIAESAARALEEHAYIPLGKIKLVIKEGIITLTGEVEWQYQKTNAENALKSLWGVKSILNLITVKPTIHPDESKIKEEIIKEFERHARIDAGRVKVKIEGNKVILEGEVSNFDEIDIAEDTAWSIPGVARVDNRLSIG